MAKKDEKTAKKSKNDEKKIDVGDVPQSALLIHKQYLKDMSFENPNAPGILHRVDQRPEMDMNILLDVQKQESDDHKHLYEVVLTLNATAKRQDETMFLAEIIYGATASVHEDLKEEQHHPLLFVEVPQLMFPFARQILANATQSGGYMPLQLAPVDFRGMYMQRFAEARKQQKEAKKA